MRAQLIRNLDVVIVVWALALGMAWTCLAIARTETGATQWCSGDQSGPVWLIGS